MTSIKKNDIELFRAGDESVMKKVYVQVKPIFVGYFLKERKMSLGDAEDLYQDSYCMLHKKIFSGQVKTLTSKWESLLIGFGKNILRNQVRKKKETLTESLESQESAKSPLDVLEVKERKLEVDSMLSLVGDVCRKVLFHFYYEEKTMNEIAVAMNYANANVAKKKKSTCLKKLRDTLRRNGTEK